MCMNNEEASRGTIIEDIEIETKARQERFQRMLQNKYEQMDDTRYRSTLKCRRCGSSGADRTKADARRR